MRLSVDSLVFVIEGDLEDTELGSFLLESLDEDEVLIELLDWYKN